jgi:hypothetical protein
MSFAFALNASQESAGKSTIQELAVHKESYQFQMIDFFITPKYNNLMI